jgi:TatA/E family protein of Tat protein translocase
MFGLGPWELLIILVLLIFFYGGKRFGQIGEGLGKSISEFKKAVRHYPSPSAEKVDKPHSETKHPEKDGVARPSASSSETPPSGSKEKS